MPDLRWSRDLLFIFPLNIVFEPIRGASETRSGERAGGREGKPGFKARIDRSSIEEAVALQDFLFVSCGSVADDTENLDFLLSLL